MAKKKSSVKTLHYPLYARICNTVFNGGTQRLAFSYQNEEIRTRTKTTIVTFPTNAVCSATLRSPAIQIISFLNIVVYLDNSHNILFIFINDYRYIDINFSIIFYNILIFFLLHHHRLFVSL